jgi:hypothetical protein
VWSVAKYVDVVRVIPYTENCVLFRMLKINTVTILMTVDGFWLVIGFIELLQLVTTSKDYALTVLHISQITVGHTSSSQSYSLRCRCLVAASTADVVLLLLGSQTVHGLGYQLLTETAHNNWTTYSIVACEAIGTVRAENAILLFTGRCLVTAGCCDSTILALSDYVETFCNHITLSLKVSGDATVEFVISTEWPPDTPVLRP